MLLSMLTMPFVWAFMFQVVHILVLRKTRVWEWGRPVLAIKNRGFLTPFVWILDGDEIYSCPTYFPQYFSEIASTVKHASAVSLLKVYVRCTFKEKNTLLYFYSVTENINNL